MHKLFSCELCPTKKIPICLQFDQLKLCGQSMRSKEFLRTTTCCSFLKSYAGFNPCNIPKKKKTSLALHHNKTVHFLQTDVFFAQIIKRAHSFPDTVYNYWRTKQWMTQTTPSPDRAQWKHRSTRATGYSIIISWLPDLSIAPFPTKHQNWKPCWLPFTYFFFYLFHHWHPLFFSFL